jgi:hypothetical protein
MTTGSLSFLKLHSPHQKVYDINFVNFGETLTTRWGIWDSTYHKCTSKYFEIYSRGFWCLMPFSTIFQLYCGEIYSESMFHQNLQNWYHILFDGENGVLKKTVIAINGWSHPRCIYYIICHYNTFIYLLGTFLKCDNKTTVCIIFKTSVSVPFCNICPTCCLPRQQIFRKTSKLSY